MGSENEKNLYNSIDKIFWEQWYPIGINIDMQARNEYYSYIPTVFDNVLKNKSGEEIANLLFSIERDRMGLEGNYEKCLEVARAILSVKALVSPLRWICIQKEKNKIRRAGRDFARLLVW